MGAPHGNRNAAGPHKKHSRYTRRKGGLVRIPRTPRQLRKAGFKKTKYKNIWIG